ncbi:O-antigen ligase family protein [Paucibacter sp. R3-3]|uniref:O-antigen ligase family protein n=1 Tax=Roseateles agri TaxID=3098619 RepID=A0ABU5DC62_9BURK|nr:O-antigen ligase family protein [Paucibacter sp. R3-3]MDY0743858.1 O-antigen ligase family protein [Paucibacter sp. R3-3]
MDIAIVFSIYLLIAFGLGLLAVGATVVIGHLASSLPGRMFQVLMWMLVIASAMAILMSGRSLRLIADALAIEAQGDVGGFIGAKILLALALGFATALCVAWLFRPWWKSLPVNRYAAGGRKPPSDAVWSLLCFYVCFSIVPFVFTDAHYFHISLVYPLFIFLALLLWMQYSAIDPVVVVKQTLSVLVLGSLVAGAVYPSLAMQPGYLGLIPGFSMRLWGITATANTLGSVALALLMIEVCEPAQRKWLHWLLLGAAAVTMVLSQSKAAIGAAALGVGLVLLWRWLQKIKASKAGSAGRGELTAMLSLILVLVFVTLGVWVSIADPDIFGGLSRRLNARAMDDLSTATGRVYIWKFAIQSGLDSPIFGNGGDFWGLETRLRTGLTGATHAHNEFLQVFSRSGSIGLLAYLWFFGVMCAYAWRAAGPSRGGSLAFMLVFFMRSMVEVPLQPNSVLGGEFFAFMMLLVYVVDRGARPLTSPREVPLPGAYMLGQRLR